MTTYIWSIDDAGSGEKLIESMSRTCAFFDERDMKSTWFVIPKPNGAPLSAGWRAELTKEIAAGHDIQLHGLTHADCYEFGPPAWPATSILSTLQPTFEERRTEFMARYTVEKLQARLEEGMAIFKNELGVVPAAFRAPCGAIAKSLFTALRNVGIHYHSVMYISGAGYQHLPHNSGSLAQPWVDDIPHRPFLWYDDVVEAPILNEYTWRGAGQRSADFIELARQDVDRIAQESPIAVLLMHTHGIADDYDHAFRRIDAVIDQVTRNGGAFSTFAAEIQSGALAKAATVAGPDLLTI
jgi:peptidoglycan/xylan/chitin deacetylase (PgdA/CDA1 family)